MSTAKDVYPSSVAGKLDIASRMSLKEIADGEYRYTWFSIVESCTNQGNHLIEYALRRVFPLEGPQLSIDSFKPLSPEQIARINRTKYLVVPGCTVLQPGHNPAMDSLKAITIPKYCLGACYMTRRLSPRGSLARGFNRKIGARDPYTHRWLRWRRIPSVFVGCPTLTLGESNRWRSAEGPIVMSFRWGSPDAIKDLAERLSRMSEVVLLDQEPTKNDGPTSMSRLKMLEFPEPQGALALYRSASLIVTNRVHATLPAIAFGIPFVFTSNRVDSRFSLLSYLGVRREPFDTALVVRKADRLLNNPNLMGDCPLDRADILRRHFIRFCDEIQQEIAVL